MIKQYTFSVNIIQNTGEKNEKKMRKKLSLMIALVLVLGAGVPSFAANTGDTVFSFAVSGVYGASGDRSKQDTSPFYVYVTQQPSGTRFFAQGLIGSSWQNKTVGVNSVSLSTRIKYSVRTLVYEAGGRKARLATMANSNAGTTQGVWSPDSSGRYNYAN